eukprot:SAG11_NODE_2584_length_3195_cov_2.145026_4_plen_71_part_00
MYIHRIEYGYSIYTVYIHRSRTKHESLALLAHDAAPTTWNAGAVRTTSSWDLSANRGRDRRVGSVGVRHS